MITYFITSSEECNEGHDNPVCSSENPVADEMEVSYQS